MYVYIYIYICSIHPLDQVVESEAYDRLTDQQRAPPLGLSLIHITLVLVEVCQYDIVIKYVNYYYICLGHSHRLAPYHYC